MTIRSGQLRQRIQIQSRSDVPSASGEPAAVWSLVAEVWASVEPLLGREFFAAQERSSTVPTKFRIRYLAGLVPRMRIIWAGRWFDIRAVQQVGGLKVEMLVMADELVERPL